MGSVWMRQLARERRKRNRGPKGHVKISLEYLVPAFLLGECGVDYRQSRLIVKDQLNFPKIQAGHLGGSFVAKVL